MRLLSSFIRRCARDIASLYFNANELLQMQRCVTTPLLSAAARRKPTYDGCAIIASKIFLRVRVLLCNADYRIDCADDDILSFSVVSSIFLPLTHHFAYFCRRALISHYMPLRCSAAFAGAR